MKHTTADKEWAVKHFERCYTINWQEPKRLKIYVRTLLTEVFQRYFNDTSDEGMVIPVWLSELCNQMNKPENFKQGNDRMLGGFIPGSKNTACHQNSSERNIVHFDAVFMTL